jgi:hypothetical protein
MFNKSLMTISKVLRPEAVAKAKALAASGVRLEAKRCKSAQHPELERRLYQAVGMGARPVTKHEILEQAARMAREMRLDDMDMGNNWCTRFIKQHDLALVHQVRRVDTTSPAASSREPSSGQQYSGLQITPTLASIEMHERRSRWERHHVCRACNQHASNGYPTTPSNDAARMLQLMGV